MCSFDCIPLEIKLKIISLVDISTLKNILLVNRDTYSLCKNEIIWKNIVINKYGNINKINTWYLTYELMSLKIYQIIRVKRKYKYTGIDQGNIDIVSYICPDKQSYIDSAFYIYLKDIWQINPDVEPINDNTSFQVEGFTDQEYRQVLSLLKTLINTNEKDLTDDEFKLRLNKLKLDPLGYRFFNFVKNDFMKDFSLIVNGKKDRFSYLIDNGLCEIYGSIKLMNNIVH